MGSTRLKQKNMLDLDGFPVLHHVYARCRATKFPTFIATPTSEDNKPIWDWCEENSVIYHKGHATNLTKRYWTAVEDVAPDADAIIRITSDCPFVNTELIVLTERLFRMAGGKGYMEFDGLHGLNVEIFDKETLAQALKQRPDEHCTTWMRKTKKIPFPPLELNTQEDYERLQTIYRKRT